MKILMDTRRRQFVECPKTWAGLCPHESNKYRAHTAKGRWFAHHDECL
ncbi:MAG: hypothetical protein MRJ96_01185 [Nitrospirales bacterium]|nr:hypothetical protein [Nitrospira sp.]MDR4500056.1 hypothetical protein [Nitrospirales bacterium]